jgi:hypothetical protein
MDDQVIKSSSRPDLHRRFGSVLLAYLPHFHGEDRKKIIKCRVVSGSLPGPQMWVPFRGPSETLVNEPDIYCLLEFVCCAGIRPWCAPPGVKVKGGV